MNKIYIDLIANNIINNINPATSDIILKIKST